MRGGSTQYYQSKEWRKVTWYGTKEYAKRLVGFKPLNLLLVSVLRRVLSPHRLVRFPVNVKEVECCVEGSKFALLEPMKCNVAREFFWGRGQLISASDQMAIKLIHHLAREADVFVDIGANTGLFSLVAAAANSDLQVHAFEIVPEVFVALFRNICRNNVADRCECHFCGIGKDGTSATMPLALEGSALPSTFSSRKLFESSESGVRVRFRSLDSLSCVIGDRRVLIKIDVEATEDDIFAQGDAFVQAHSPDILCEILPRAPTVGVVQPFLERHGYRTLRVEDGNLVAVPRLEPHADYWDWLFTKRTNERLFGLDVIECSGHVRP